ncbi:hypothetical protein AVEN_241963-1 [Araneus ventricosus]|uniref:Uncharacterized protein n=1 Tax=Araneus ventricosus TaxID=182803 RepID=A0A4Y2PW15_ARAVE|nr:hypothetical protein AVEN_241963-1 [Araneus ventricosus]
MMHYRYPNQLAHRNGDPKLGLHFQPKIVQNVWGRGTRIHHQSGVCDHIKRCIAEWLPLWELWFPGSNHRNLDTSELGSESCKRPENDTVD